MIQCRNRKNMSRYLVLATFLAAFVCQGTSSEIWLEERNVHYISHDYFGTTISIPKHFSDTLLSCHIIFPNRMMYEAYPNKNIPFTNVFFGESTSPFTGCAVGFRGVGIDFSGTYELLSSVRHAIDNSITLTRQRFHLTVVLPNQAK